MTTSGVPQGPPWKFDDVADVQAGVYPADVEAQLRAAIAADPEGAALLAALDGVVDQLSLLPTPAMPPDVAARLDAALLAAADERDGVVPIAAARPFLHATPAPTAPVTSTPLPAGVADLDQARRRRQGWFAGIGAVAAAAAIGTVVMLNLPGDTGGSGVAGSGPAPQAALPFDSPSLLRHFVVLDNGIGRPVAIADRDGCLDSLDISADTVLGIADGTFEGQPATVVVTTADTAPDQVRLVIVTATCSADGAEILDERTATR